MPAIPQFQSRVTAQPALQERLPEGFGQAVPQATARAGEAMAAVGARIFETAQNTAYHEAIVDYAERLQALRGEVAAEADPVRMGERWQTGSREILADVQSRMPGFGPARGDLARAARLWVARETPDIQRMQAQRTTQRATAAIINLRDNLAGQAAGNPALFPVLADQFDEALRVQVETGAIAEDRAERMRGEFARSVSRARVRREIQRNPGAARELLLDPQRFSGLSPEDREDLAAEASGLETERLQTADAQGVEIERTTWQTAAKQASDVTDDVYSKAAAGGVDESTVRALDWNRNLMPVSAFEAARRVVGGRVASHDDPDVVDALTTRIGDDADAFRREAERALIAERITPQRYRDLMAQNARAQGNTPEVQAYRAGRSALTDAFDGPEEVGLWRSRTLALSEYDQWAANNPRATPAEMREAAQQIAGTYRPEAVARGRASLPMPYGFTGWQEEIDEHVVDGAEEMLVDDLDNGRMTQAEAAVAARALNAWRFVLREQEQRRR